MNILMLSPFSPYPATSGARIRQWELIQHLSRRHHLTVVYNAFTKEEYGKQHGCWSVNILRFPSFMSPLALPDDIRTERKEHLEQWFQRNKDNPLMNEILDRYQYQYVRFYENKALSDAEVLQNYNANKARLGL